MVLCSQKNGNFYMKISSVMKQNNMLEVYLAKVTCLIRGNAVLEKEQIKVARLGYLDQE